MKRWYWVPICPGPCLCCCWHPVRRCCICRIIDSPHGIQSSGYSLLPPLCPLSLWSSRLCSLIVSAEAPSQPGTSLLSFGGLEVFRNTDQLSSSWTVYSIVLIITLRLFRFEGDDHRRKVPLWVYEGACHKNVLYCVDFEHLLGPPLWVCPHTCSVQVSRRNGGKGGGGAGTIEFFRTDKFRIHPLKVFVGPTSIAINA